MEEKNPEANRGFWKKHWKKVVGGGICFAVFSVLCYNFYNSNGEKVVHTLAETYDHFEHEVPSVSLTNDTVRPEVNFSKLEWPRSDCVYTLPDGKHHSIEKFEEALSHGILLADNQGYRSSTTCHRKIA